MIIFMLPLNRFSMSRTDISGIKTPYTLILADLFADTAGRCIGLVLMQQLVFSDSGSLTGLIAIQFFNLAPSICTGPFVGILIDRSNPKLILLWVNAIRLILVFCLSIDSCSAVMLIIYLMGIVMANGSAIGISAWIPMLLPGERILDFNAKNESIALLGAAATPLFITGLIAGGSIISALISAGFMLALSLAAVYYTVPAGSTAAVNHFPAIKPSRRGRSTFFGYAHKAISGLLYEYIILAVVIFTGMIVAMALPVLHINTFNGDILLWGFFMSSFQMGAASSSLILSRQNLNLSENRIVLLGIFSITMLLLLLSLLRAPWVIMILMYFFGASNTLIHILIASAVQRHTDGMYTGRSMSVFKAYQGCCMLIAVSFSSVIIYLFSAQLLFIIGAVIGCMGAVLILAFTCARRKTAQY